MNRFSNPIPLAVLVASALILAACGGSGSATTTSSPAATSSTDSAATTVPAPSTTAEHEDGADHSDDEHDATTTTTMAENADVDMIIDVVMDDFTFDPPDIEVSAGQDVLFRVSNVGVVEHEFRLSNPHRIEEHLAEGHAHHGDEGEGGHHDEQGDVFILLQPGESGEMVMTFPEDTTLYTQIACLIPGHYEAGMVGDLTYAGS